SEEHTSELQSQSNLVCRLLLEKKNVVALYRERHGAVERRHVARAGIGQCCGDGELRVGIGDRAGLERSEVAGTAQVVADDLQRIAAVLGLLVGALDLTALAAVAGEQR